MTNSRILIPVLVVCAIAIGVFAYVPALVGRIRYAQAEAEAKVMRASLDGLGRDNTMSPLYQAVAATVKPAVVVIRTSERLKTQVEPNVQNFLRRFFGEDVAPKQSQPQYYVREGIGSGIIVDAKNGYVLTNRHVVSGAQTAEVVLFDGRTVEAEWARTDKGTDLAIVKIRPGDLVSVPLGDSDEMHVGDCVLAIGAPEGLPQTVTSGIISAKGRTTSDGYESFLQTDAAINPGNSGGPLVNMEGKVIGINTAIISPSGVNAGLGLAIPSNVARKVMAQLTQSGA